MLITFRSMVALLFLSLVVGGEYSSPAPSKVSNIVMVEILYFLLRIKLWWLRHVRVCEMGDGLRFSCGLTSPISRSPWFTKASKPLFLDRTFAPLFSQSNQFLFEPKLFCSHYCSLSLAFPLRIDWKADDFPTRHLHWTRCCAEGTATTVGSKCPSRKSSILILLSFVFSLLFITP